MKISFNPSDLRDLITMPGKRGKRIRIGIAAAGIAACGLIAQPFIVPEGGKEALVYAQEKIENEGISKAALKDDLTGQYSDQAAEYALKKVDKTDWNQEAVEAFDSLSADRNISRKKLQSSLEDRQFEDDEIIHAFSQRESDLDFYAFARKALGNYDAENIISRSDARLYLEGELFETDEIQSAIDSSTVDWQKNLNTIAKDILSSPVSEDGLKDQLLDAEFSEKEISSAIQKLNPDFDKLCLTCMDLEDQDGILSEQALRQAASKLRFSDEQIQKALKKRNTDWKYNAVRYARSLCGSSTGSGKFSSSDLSSKIKDAGFLQEHADFVVKYYDSTAGTVDDEETIREKIRAEEEAKKKAEEKARRQAEQEQMRLQEVPAAPEVSAVPDSLTVWIPCTGSKYHSSSRCSNMKNPSQVTMSQAIALGYGRCSKCW